MKCKSFYLCTSLKSVLARTESNIYIWLGMQVFSRVGTQHTHDPGFDPRTTKKERKKTSVLMLVTYMFSLDYVSSIRYGRFKKCVQF